MADPFQEIQAGDPIPTDHILWNAIIGAAKSWKRGQRQFVNAQTQPASSTVIRVKNDTGNQLPRASVLGLDGPIFSPCDAVSIDPFLREITFSGVIPVLAAPSRHRRRYCVTLDPLDINAIGRAFLSGVCPVQVQLNDVYDEYANITDGQTGYMTSSRMGHARILWSEQDEGYAYGGYCSYGYTTGQQWCIVRLGDSCTFSIGIASGDISPRVGSVYGTGNVGLVRSMSGLEDGPTETLQVFNASSAVFPYGSGINDGMYCAVSLDSEDVAWVAPLDCESDSYYG